MTTLSSRLTDLAKGIRENVPSHRDPERFHDRKAELERQVLALADEARVDRQ